MIIEHLGKKPRIHPSAYIAPSATVCGDVENGKETRILFNTSIIAEGGSIKIGSKCIILENAVVRSSPKFSTHIGDHTLIGPHTHVVGCRIEECVFIATGASIFHGANIGRGSEVRINGIVHLKTQLPPNTTVPIGWIAVGSPAQVFPPNEHEKIWRVQEPLNFPKSVYGIDRPPKGETIIPEITAQYSQWLATHKDDVIVDKK
ncbi:MAG: gamma carbonic anhydrase family protein [Candidatus Aminicenantes bacterium]|nr:gamma carbonic anhydrase family protein [Candidatus Aminicenantes bacterium]